MTKFGSARAVLVGAAVVTLAGCGASAGSSGAAAGNTSSAATSSTTSPGATSSPSSNSNTLVTTGSVPFPIAVGNTWVYKTTASINGENGTETNKVDSVVPVPGGHRVTMSETTDVAGSTTTGRDVFTFYANGTIAYPLTGSDVTVAGNGVVWPDAADLASGQTFRSVLRVRTGRTGPSQYQNADVAVRGAGTETVTVPAGTYQATLVIMTMTVKVGNYSSTVEVDTWQAEGTGPVKTEVLIHAAGNTTASSTQELVSFTKG
jgi:uncharacterized protein DUF3108